MEKKCTNCKETKEVSFFYKRLDGFTPRCKECFKSCIKDRYKKDMQDPIKKEIRRKKDVDKYHRYKKEFPHKPNGIWISGYEGVYSIDKNGTITRHHRFKSSINILTPKPDGKGYLKVRLCKNGYCKIVSVARMVGIHFIPNTENKPEINHIDGVKSNNHYTNLEWCTRSENMIHAHRVGLKIGINKRDKNGRIAKGNQS
jgi:hypothetical protein